MVYFRLGISSALSVDTLLLLLDSQAIRMLPVCKAVEREEGKEIREKDGSKGNHLTRVN